MLNMRLNAIVLVGDVGGSRKSHVLLKLSSYANVDVAYIYIPIYIQLFTNTFI